MLWVVQGARSGLDCAVFQVARSLGILDEVNRMKVVPGASPSSSLTNKNSRYMEVDIYCQHSCVLRSWIQVGSGSSMFPCTLLSYHLKTQSRFSLNQ